jgi:hypothetical protein
MKVVAAYYIMSKTELELIRYFETREDANKYLMNDYFGSEPEDKYEMAYRESLIKEKMVIKEISIVDVLNELHQVEKDTNDRLDRHNF